MTLSPVLRDFLPAKLSPLIEAELERLHAPGAWRPPDDDHDVMRLLQPDEAVAATSDLRTSWLRLREEILVLWTDDNGNHAGCYVEGELAPRVVLVDHEEPDDTVRFHSPSSFQDARRAGHAAGQSWRELPTDYPARSDGDHPFLAADRALALAFLEAYGSDPANRSAAHHALQLIPYADTELILPLLQTDDMWIQEHACRVLGIRQYTPALEPLRRIAIDGTHNGRIAALLALGGMPSADARRVVAELRSIVPPEFHLYLR